MDYSRFRPSRNVIMQPPLPPEEEAAILADPETLGYGQQPVDEMGRALQRLQERRAQGQGGNILPEMMEAAANARRMRDEPPAPDAFSREMSALLGGDTMGSLMARAEGLVNPGTVRNGSDQKIDDRVPNQDDMATYDGGIKAEMVKGMLPNDMSKADLPSRPMPLSGGQPAGAGRGLNLSPQAKDLIARTILGEAQNQPREGRAAVAHTILNRLQSGRYGQSVEDVLFAPKQFEPWNTRRGELMRLDPNSREMRSTLSLVDKVLSGQVPDPTGGATHFANVGTVQARGNNAGMKWIRNMQQNGSSKQIGAHTFGNPDGQPGAGGDSTKSFISGLISRILYGGGGGATSVPPGPTPAPQAGVSPAGPSPARPAGAPPAAPRPAAQQAQDVLKNPSAYDPRTVAWAQSQVGGLGDGAPGVQAEAVAPPMPPMRPVGLVGPKPAAPPPNVPIAPPAQQPRNMMPPPAPPAPNPMAGYAGQEARFRPMPQPAPQPAVPQPPQRPEFTPPTGNVPMPPPRPPAATGMEGGPQRQFMPPVSNGSQEDGNDFYKTATDPSNVGLGGLLAKLFGG